MKLAIFDWLAIAAIFVISFGIGIYSSRRSGKSFNEYFLAGNQMSWWLLGISMVATTFSADTPNLVADIVRTNGVSGNWVWWAFLLTGLLTTFVYAKLWKRSRVLTDLEFYELRYSGKSAAFLRGFRALYLGVVFNCLVMAVVMLSAIKLGGCLIGVSPITAVLVAGSITVVYTMYGGLRGVILTDCFQFIVAMFGSIVAAVVLCNLPEVGGLSKLLTHERVVGKLSLLPDLTNPDAVISLFVMPLVVLWWSSWYPGAEPGGGGYIAQRMLGAKNEEHATMATLLFTIAHYALRPWPWIVVALASLIIFPDLQSMQTIFPGVDESILHNDLAYPAMLTLLPSGLLGVVIASLVCAFMSTMSTHLNWGSSYVTHDFYRRFVNPDATEDQLVRVGRWSTAGLMLIASALSLTLSSALEAFNIILQIGAGTGLIFILRWFWWRINAHTEIAGMVASFLVALFFQVMYPLLNLPELASWQKLLVGVGVTTLAWMLIAIWTPATDEQTLEDFYRRVHPSGPGWRPVRNRLAAKGISVRTSTALPSEFAAMVATAFLVYGILFGVGYYLYSQLFEATIGFILAGVATFILFALWPKLDMDRLADQPSESPGPSH
jgi:solute:Na+ symporter, SSS family